MKPLQPNNQRVNMTYDPGLLHPDTKLADWSRKELVAKWEKAKQELEEIADMRTHVAGPARREHLLMNELASIERKLGQDVIERERT